MATSNPVYIPSKSPFRVPQDLRAYLEREFLSISRAIRQSVTTRVDVTDFGAIGDDSTDNLGAFDAAYSRAVELATAGDHGVEIFVPEGKFRFSDEWDVYRPNSPRVDITIRGVDQFNSILVANFYGAAKAIIRAVDPLGVTRCSPTSIRDLGFENASTSGGITPLFIWVLGHGESRVDRVRFGSSNNTHMRLISAQNLRGTDIVSFFGGRHFNYKATSGLTFTVDTGANTITASSAIFSADDVGKYFFVFPTNVASRIRYLISGFTSSTVVSYTGALELAATAQAGHFEPARCSMAAGDPTLTANADCFTSAMVGLVLYIRRAADGAQGDKLLRATIASFNAADSVELDVAPDNAITDEFFGVATLDMGKEAAFAGSSDVQLDKLHIEHYDGIAFVAQDTDSYMLEGKIHGETVPTDSAKSLAACWLDDFGGKLQLNLDSSCAMGDTRVYACNLNDLVLFDAVWSRHIINGTLFKTDLFTNEDGYIVCRGLHLFDDVADPTDLIDDANEAADSTDPRILFEGVVNMVGDSAKARIYSGRAYFLPDGTGPFT